MKILRIAQPFLLVINSHEKSLYPRKKSETQTVLQGKAAGKQPAAEPAKETTGDPLAAEKPATNGTEKATEPEPEPATAAGVEAGKTKGHEEPKAAAEGEKVVAPGIGEAKPVGEAE